MSAQLTIREKVAIFWFLWTQTHPSHTASIKVQTVSHKEQRAHIHSKALEGHSQKCTIKKEFINLLNSLEKAVDDTQAMELLKPYQRLDEQAIKTSSDPRHEVHFSIQLDYGDSYYTLLALPPEDLWDNLHYQNQKFTIAAYVREEGGKFANLYSVMNLYLVRDNQRLELEDIIALYEQFKRDYQVSSISSAIQQPSTNTSDIVLQRFQRIKTRLFTLLPKQQLDALEEIEKILNKF